MKVSQPTAEPIQPLYSIATIALGAFLGGPLGATYVLYYNFKALEQPDRAKWTLGLGIGATLLLLFGLVLLPQSTVEETPQFLIPVLTMSITVGIAHYFQGETLQAQQESDDLPAPMWKAALISLLLAVWTIALLFVLALLLPGEVPEEEGAYTEQLERFNDNESESLRFYDLLERDVSDSVLLGELENQAIPLWQENVEIATNFSNIDSLDDPEGDMATLLEYAQLRLAIFETSRLVLLEDTDAYDGYLDSLYERMDMVLQQM